jgi:hypothetical protein
MAVKKGSRKAARSSRKKHYQALKRFGDLIEGSCVGEIIAKEADAHMRLAFKVDRRFLVHGGGAIPNLGQFPSFDFISVGSTNIESDIGRNLLQELSEVVSHELSPKDCRITVAQDFLSQYLRAILEEVPGPRALAIEFLLYDPTMQIAATIAYDGDFEYINVENSDGDVLVIGGYDSELKKNLQVLFGNLVKKPKFPSEDEIKKELISVQKRFQIERAGIIDF